MNISVNAIGANTFTAHRAATNFNALAQQSSENTASEMSSARPFNRWYDYPRWNNWNQWNWNSRPVYYNNWYNWWNYNPAFYFRWW